MEYQLVDTKRQGNHVVIFINKDHSEVQIAMEHKPINRLALSFLALRDLAKLLNQEKELQQTVFNVRDLHKIEKVNEEIQEGLIFRMLMDKCVKAKTAA